MNPAELAAEIAALRRELTATRGLAEAALAAAEAARGDLEALRTRGHEPAIHVGPALGRALAEHLSSESAHTGHLSSGPEDSSGPALVDLSSGPAPAPADLSSGPAPAPAPPVTLASLAELVSEPDHADLSLRPAAPDLSPRPSATLIGLSIPRPGGDAQIDLDLVDGVANDDEQRRRARLAALESRLQRADHDAPRRARLLELAQSRRAPDPSRGLGKYIAVLLLSGAAIAQGLWPLAFVPPVLLLCWYLWRYEQNERVARLARGFAVPVRGRVLRDGDEVLAWFGAFWPARVRPEDIWTSHRHIAVACEQGDFPTLLDVQLERTRVGDVEYRPRVDFYIATTWPARLPLLRPGSAEMSPAIAELYARMRRAGFTIRVESEAGLMLHGSETVVERVRTDPAQLGGLHNIVRDAINLARQLGAAPPSTGITASHHA